jgi:hypothetical protein
VRRGAAWSALVLGGALLAGSGRAEAFVRSLDANSSPVYWKTSCVQATIYLNGFEAKVGGLPVDQAVKSITAAAHAWSPDAVTCPGTTDSHPNLEIMTTLAPVDAKPPTIAWDSRNAIVIRTDAWAKSGNTLIEGYKYDALAVTSVTSRGDGFIVDADIEVNAVNKNWIDLDPGVTVSASQSTFEPNDLQNTLTHEFGHFLGLDHTCFNPQPGKVWPVDDQGQMVPDCQTAPAAVARTVMFDSAQSLETSKRFLSDDDKRAVCAISSPARTCDLDEPSDGCTLAPTHAGCAWAALAAGTLALLTAARRGGRARR